MHADIGGASVLVAHLPRRRARAQLFTASGRGLLVAALVIGALAVGLGVVTDRAHSAPNSTAYGYIGR
jgi:hypothetical protein